MTKSLKRVYIAVTAETLAMFKTKTLSKFHKYAEVVPIDDIKQF
jgi:hypothetical protein